MMRARKARLGALLVALPKYSSTVSFPTHSPSSSANKVIHFTPVSSFQTETILEGL